MANNKIFVTGIGTNVGKTVVSAILRRRYNAVYWKPIQAGDLDNSDSMKVEKWSHISEQIITERFQLNTPASPHFSAKEDGIKITAKDLELPEIEKNLIIEGAGGLFVPINEEGLLYIDVLESWKIPVVLVSRHYLGSINHTLMSLELLKFKNIEVKALFFVGDENKSTETIILKKFPCKNVIRIPESKVINEQFIMEQASFIPFNIFE